MGGKGLRKLVMQDVGEAMLKRRSATFGLWVQSKLVILGQPISPNPAGMYQTDSIVFSVQSFQLCCNAVFVLEACA
jgi:hypothetical protein